MKKIPEIGTRGEKWSNFWTAHRQWPWITVMALVGLVMAYWVFINADVYLFTTMHPSQVRIRKAVFDNAIASGSAAQHDYLENH